MADLGCMSPQMSQLAQSQDIIGWKNFMEGRISRHFFDMPHSQWIFRNFTLHDKQKGWLRRKELHDIMLKLASSEKLTSTTNLKVADFAGNGL